MDSKKYWIEISRDEFLDAILRLKPSRMLKSYLSKDLEISYSAGAACFNVNGAKVVQPAKGEWEGIVSVKYSYGLNFTKIKPINDPVRFEFENQILKIESARIPAKWRDV